MAENVQVVLDLRTFDFCTNHTFVHYKFSPLIPLLYANLDFNTQQMNRHLEHRTVLNCILCLLNARKADPSGFVF